MILRVLRIPRFFLNVFDDSKDSWDSKDFKGFCGVWEF